MILYRKMDITTVEKGIIAHGVNAQFVMNAGVALALRTKWPIVYKEYMEFRHTVYHGLLGKVCLVYIEDNLFVANCFTQMYYGRTIGVKYAHPSAIRTALETCLSECNARGLDLYIPRIGCGLGGLKWGDDVLPIVEKISEKLDDKLILYVCDY